MFTNRVRLQARNDRNGAPKKNIHKRTKLPPAVEGNLSQAPQGACPSCLVGEEYHVSRPTIHKTLARGRKHDFSVYISCNAHFLEQGWGECAYTIEAAYTDNSREFQGNPEHHAFAERCRRNGIERQPEGSSPEIAAAPASFFLRTGSLGYHRETWIKSAFSYSGSSAATAEDKTAMEDDTIGAIKSASKTVDCSEYRENRRNSRSCGAGQMTRGH